MQLQHASVGRALRCRVLGPIALATLCVFAAFALTSVTTPTARAQGITTSALAGVVTDSATGKPIAGATVMIVHEPTGTRATATTRANGRFSVSSLRVGGPYTVTATADDFQSATRSELALALGQSSDIALALTPNAAAAAADEIVQMAAFTVQGSRDDFGAGKTGPTTNLSADQIDKLASSTRAMQDIISKSPFVTLMDKDRGEINAVGQNLRYNSLQIDSVPTNDTYGLQASGFPSQRNPISVDFIEAVTIDIAPYDVRRSGFTGALVNAVTKSGSNEFHGSFSYFYADQDMRGKRPLGNEGGAITLAPRVPFKEYTWNATLGGPIILNRLFFFIGYEEFQRTTVAAGQLFSPDATALQQIIDRAKALGYDPGTLTGPSNVMTDKKINARLDWNISQNHRLSVSYRKSDSIDPKFPDYSSTTGVSLSNYWYDALVKNESYVAQLYSTWTQNFKTEIFASLSEYDAVRDNRGAAFPSVEIRGVLKAGVATPNPANAGDWGSVFLGTENSSMENILNYKTKTGSASGEYLLGDHTLTFGTDAEHYDFFNSFLQSRYGRYQFGSSTSGSNPVRPGVAQWLAGVPGLGAAYTYAYEVNGLSSDADWGYTMAGVYLQDKWQPAPALTFTAGVRLDTPIVNDKPAFNPAVLTTFGMRNDATMDGNETIAPRLAVNYQFPFARKTELRGGLGLFQGRNPAVWLSNAYSNTGIATKVNTALPAAFVADPFAQPPGSPAAARAAINLTAPDYRMPSVWRGNLALDTQLPLFGGTTLSFEFIKTRTNEAPAYENLNLRYFADNPASRLPDGRIRYIGGTAARQREAGFSDVFLLRNTDKGQSTAVSIGLDRPLRKHWAASLSYTYNKADEVSPITSSTAGSNWGNRAVFNPNEDISSTANYEVRNRFLASATYQLEFFKNYKTAVTLTYEGRSGRPYSWVFNGDLNGDNQSFNDLFYVPTGPDDPRVTYATTAARDAFWNFVNSSTLKNYKGQVVPRNSERSSFVHQFDMRLTQQLPIWKKLRAELLLDLINIGNMLNDEWGRSFQVPFSFTRGVATASVNAAGQYVYTFTAPQAVPVRVGPDGISGAPESTWGVQVGVRVKF